MNCPPLAIVQARVNSTRLPGKVLLPLADGRPILAWVVERAVAAFGKANVVVATTTDPRNAPIVAWCDDHDARVEAWDGPEADVLSRFYHVAHAYRWNPDSIIVRATADDPFREVEAMWRVAVGERLPVEQGAEAFTLAMLDAAHDGFTTSAHAREHITDALFPSRIPMLADGNIWTVDCPEDYARAVERSKTAAAA